MGGGPMAALGVSLDNVMLQQAALNVQQNLSNQTSAAFNHQMAMAQQQAYRNQHPTTTPNQMFGSPWTGLITKPSPTVASTAASRVKKAEWELEYDRKDREVDEMIERQRQERERVWNEENDSETDA